MLQEEVNTDNVRQTKRLFVPHCFAGRFPPPSASHLFNFLHSGKGLPYLGLFIPENHPAAFCLQVTHPGVTFNSWTKKKEKGQKNSVVMLCGPSLPGGITTEGMGQSCIHSLQTEPAD